MSSDIISYSLTDTLPVGALRNDSSGHGNTGKDVTECLKAYGTSNSGAEAVRGESESKRGKNNILLILRIDYMTLLYMIAIKWDMHISKHQSHWVLPRLESFG